MEADRKNHPINIEIRQSQDGLSDQFKRMVEEVFQLNRLHAPVHIFVVPEHLTMESLQELKF